MWYGDFGDNGFSNSKVRENKLGIRRKPSHVGGKKSLSRVKVRQTDIVTERY